MFGYVRPCIPDLMVKDHELYKAAYCGLCRTMGKTTGCFSKIALNYDFVFLALTRMAVGGDEVTVKKRHCGVHPFKTRLMLEPNDSLKYSSRATVLLTRLKLKDNVKDSKGFAKLKAKIAGTVSIFFKKTDKSHKELEAKIISSIDALSRLEENGSDSIDETASTSGELLGNIASYGLEGMEERLLYDIGFHLGKLIYVMDAVDDYKSDLKSGSFNVLKNAFGDELTENTKSMLKCAMTLELEKMSRGVELIDFSKCRDVERIIKNIVYIGLPNEIERIILGKKKENKK